MKPLVAALCCLVGACPVYGENASSELWSAPAIATLELLLKDNRARPFGRGMAGNSLEKFESAGIGYRILAAAYCEDGSFAAKVLDSWAQDRAKVRVLRQSQSACLPDHSLPYAEGETSELAFSPDCSTLIGSGQGTRPWILDTTSGNLKPLPIEAGSSLHNPKFFDSSTIYFQRNHSSIVSYDAKAGELRPVWTQPGDLLDYHVEPNKDILIAYPADSDDPRAVRGKDWRSAGTPKFVFAKITPDAVRSAMEISSSYDDAKAMRDSPDGSRIVYAPKLISNEFAVIETQSSRAKHRWGIGILSLREGRVVKEIDGGSSRRINDHAFVFLKEESRETPAYLFDLRSMTQKRLSESRRGRTEILAAHSRGVIAQHRSTVEWENLRAYDLAGDERSIYPGGARPIDTITEKHEIVSADGVSNPAYLFRRRSRAGNPKGVVIYVHGGGCHVHVPVDSSWVIEGAYDLVQADYDVLMVNYRSPHGKKERCGTGEIDDILAAQSFVQKSYGKIPLFVWGHSQGGYLVNLLATHQADKLKAKGVISASGLWKYDADPYTRVLLDNHYSRDRMPIDKIGNLNVPLLLFHGQQDSNVGFEQAERFVEKAKAAGKDFTAFLPKDEPHHIGNPANYDEWMKMFLEFLEKNRSASSQVRGPNSRWALYHSEPARKAQPPMPAP